MSTVLAAPAASPTTDVASRAVAAPGRRARAAVAVLLPLCLYIVVAAALFPSVTTHLTGALPAALTDPPSQVWVLAWDVHALTTNPTHLYDGNIFYPLHQTLAFQDTALSVMPIVAPIILLTGDAVLAYNVLFVLSFALCAWSAFLLARLLSGSTAGAYVAGAIYGFSAYRMAHLIHLNLLCAFFIPLVLLFWERARRGDARGWIGVGAFFILQALAALYYAAFLAVALVLLFVLEALHARRLRRIDPTALPRLRRFALGGAVAALATSLIIAPLLLPYLRTGGSLDGLAQAQLFSADIRDFVHAIHFNVLYGWTGAALGISPLTLQEQYLWPGLITLGLIVYGLRGPRASGDEAFVKRSYLVLCLATALLCLGPSLKVFGDRTGIPLPYIFLYNVPGFAGWRDPTRFGAIYTLALAVLAAYGVARLQARPLLSATRRRLVVALVAGVLAESWIAPIPTPAIATGAAVPPVYRWLAARPDGAAILEFPVNWDNWTTWSYQTASMYFSTYHWHPILSGIGRFDPPEITTRAATFNSFPSAAALALLRARRVRYVVVHQAWVGAGARARIAASARHERTLRLAKSWPDADVYIVF